MRLAVFIATPALLATVMSFHEAPVAQPQLAPTDIGGVVSSVNGAEAGVWVIAETNDLPTKFAKIVVTDDRGRYLIPELPKARYTVWARGYGLVDSHKVPATPGTALNLQARVAPSAAAAAEYYPAIYWYSMLRAPLPAEFPGTGPDGNGINPALKSQDQWLDIAKTNGCYGCHALGNKAMRAIPKELGDFKSSEDAWQRRIQSGQALTQMTTALGRMGNKRALRMFADWTDRVAAGELPASKPTRPQGVERNVVLTMWDWAGPKDYLHDVVSTDKRDPRVNPHGLLFGATEESTDLFPVLDPVSHKASQVKMLVRDPATPSSKNAPMLPSPFWGEERIWDSQTSMHNPMLDEKGRVWFTSRVRPPANPDFCKKGSDHPSAKLFPVESANRHLSMYDPKSERITLISTCFPTHHLVFSEDANHTLWTSAGGPGSGALGWPNREMFAATGEEVKSQGWSALSLPNATGKHCPDGWTLYPFPGPKMANDAGTGSAEASYYTWVDQFDTFGLGKNVPIATGNANESLLALVNSQWVNLHVPYPLGFYTKWMDGRIDDPNAGWKGKGLWATVSTRAPFHMEGGKGTTSKVVHFQLRPDPLAR